MDILSSRYIIDGVAMELTPRQMLDEATGKVPEARPDSGEGSEPIVDESIDPAPSDGIHDAARTDEYLKLIAGPAARHRHIPAFCAAEMTRSEISRALIDAIWRSGHFRIDDLTISVKWNWETTSVGNMAAFYRSVEEACNYANLLGIGLTGYEVNPQARHCSVDISVSVENNPYDGTEDEIEPVEIAESIDRTISDAPDGTPDIASYELPFKTAAPSIRKARKCAAHISENHSNWLIYIPFDTCKFRLGGSLLAAKTGIAGGKVPEILDNDYFIDCYEVIREFVEDGIIVSGATVSSGGLISALNRMVGDNVGMDVDISGIMQSYGETDAVKILFGEIPGAVVEIRDSDFDYVDAEMLLQDVAYYPVGHPGDAGLRISKNDSGIAGILQSLMHQQDAAAEGED